MKLFIVVEGGCVRYVSTDSQEANVDIEVIYPDDLRDTPEPAQLSLLAWASSLPRVW